MSVLISLENAIDLLQELTRAEIRTEKEVYTFSIQTQIRGSSNSDDSAIEAKLGSEELKIILESLKQKSEYEETTLVDRNSYEVLVRHESSRPLPPYGPLRELPFEIQDEENGLSYILDYASHEYFLFLLQKTKDFGSLRAISRLPYFIRETRYQKDKLTKDIFSLAKHFVGPRLLTLKITSTKNLNVSEFEKFADAYFFQLSYNFDQAILPQRYLDEILRLGRITRLRRVRPEELEAPKRTYIPDLIHHYQLAVASENPALEFLSYYHVMEHFFESISDEALVEEIRSLLTQPDFSYKRKRDIEKLIKKVKAKQLVDGDNVRFRESDALRLTLQKYVEPTSLLEKIKEYDDSLVSYYKIEKVGFSGGDAVNLELEDSQQLITLLSKRIYKTRNALVHSKDGDRDKFIPFKHDKILIREVPLMRFIAEIIIVESSKVMS